jgi:hypothetical protein
MRQPSAFGSIAFPAAKRRMSELVQSWMGVVAGNRDAAVGPLRHVDKAVTERLGLWGTFANSCLTFF